MSIITPKYFTKFDVFIGVSLISIKNWSLLPPGLVSDSEDNIHWVLLQLIKSLLLAAQAITLAISFSVLIRRSSLSRSLRIKTASSAYKINLELTRFGRSFIYIRKSKGPRTLPWRTPISTVHMFEEYFASVLTYYIQFERYDFINW